MGSSQFITEGQISSSMERFHGRERYIGELGKPEECRRLVEEV